MIIQGDDEVVLGSKGANTKFKITTSAKAFKILSSGLYKNKIRAIVRELACNCLDAHKLNGFEGAFQINVPGQMDPRFIIRDFGPGLSKDGLENLYTTYFASTKNNSNDFIGALGLGSKSPFSYTDTFTVVSYHEGKVYGYTAMLDNGEPIIRLLFEEDMKEDDKTGLEITVPVKTADIQRWKDEIKYVVRPFGEAKVNLVGSKLEPRFFPEFDEYYVIPSTDYSYEERSGLFAVYGSIVYPLNDVPGLGDTWIGSRNDVAFIKFPLGELDIAASREELSLDEQTIANIKSRIIHLDKRVMDADLKEWRETTNERKVVRELGGLNYRANQMLQNKAAVVCGNKTYKQLYAKYDVKARFIDAGIVYEVCVDPKMKRLKSTGARGGVGVTYMFGTQRKKLTIIIDDCKKQRLPAVRALNEIRYSKDDKAKKILKENPWLPERGEEILFVNPESELEMNTLPDVLRQMGEDEVVMKYTSEFFAAVEDYVVVVQREYQPKPKAPSAVRWYKTKEGSWAEEELFYNAADAEDIDGWVVFKNGYNYVTMEPEYGVWNNFGGICQCADVLGITEFHIVRPQLQKKIIKLDQCQDMLVAISDKFVELVDEVDYDYYTATSGRAYNYIRHIEKYPELNFLMKYLNESGKSSKEAKDLFSLRSWLNPVNISSYTNPLHKDQVYNGLHIVRKLNEYADSRAAERIKKFEGENIVVTEYMRNRYNMEGNAVAEIVKLLGE